MVSYYMGMKFIAFINPHKVHQQGFIHKYVLQISFDLPLNFKVTEAKMDLFVSLIDFSHCTVLHLFKSVDANVMK